MKYRMAIFDFDGTLADSFPFFVRVINQLAEQHGFKKVDLDLVPTYRQYGARQLMEQVGMPAWKLPFVVKSFTSLMRQMRRASHYLKMLTICCGIWRIAT
jgi:phosphoglycolate phosphatase